MASSTPSLCGNGCGFYGTPATNNLCSKCYKYQLEHEVYVDDEISLSLNQTIKVCSAQELKPSIDQLLSLGPDDVENKKRSCSCCNKKMKLFGGFSCRCGGVFCCTHRLPETHSCSFDYKKMGRVALAKDNPLVCKDKLETRI